MEKIIDRLAKYMTLKGLNDNQVTVKAGLSIGILGKAKKNGKSLSAENIAKVLHVYKDLNSDWLLTGNGNMLKSQEETINDDSEIFYLRKKLDEKDELIKNQMQNILDLQKKLSKIEAEVEILTTKQPVEVELPQSSFSLDIKKQNKDSQ